MDEIVNVVTGEIVMAPPKKSITSIASLKTWHLIGLGM